MDKQHIQAELKEVEYKAYTLELYMELRKRCLELRLRLNDDDKMKKYLADVAENVSKALINALR